MPPNDVPPIHDDLVARLTSEARPVRRLWPPALRLAAWLLLAALVMVIGGTFGLRDDVVDQVRRPLYGFEVATLLLAAAAAAAAALRAAVPGLDARRPVGLAVGLAGVGLALHIFAPTPTGTVDVLGLRCAACVGLFGLLPWVALFVAVRRAAPLDGPETGAYLGAAAFLVGAAAVRVACPVDDGLHLLAWHAVPAVAWTAASTLVGAAWLGRWQTERDADRAAG